MRDEKAARGDPGMGGGQEPHGAFLVLARSQGFIAGPHQGLTSSPGEQQWDTEHSPAQGAGSQPESWHRQQTQPESHLERDEERL